MNKKEIIASIAEREGITKVMATAMYEATVGAMVEALKNGDSLSLPELGKFVIKNRAERVARNPKTGEEVICPAKKAVGFKPTKSLKEAVAEL